MSDGANHEIKTGISTEVAVNADSERREFLRRGSLLTGAAIMSLVPDAIRSGAWAAGSDAPEKTEVKIGFIPLTDCSSVVMAAVMEFDKKYGIKIVPTKEASWASVRDKLVNGELDAAHVLYGLIYGVQMGIGGPKTIDNDVGDSEFKLVDHTPGYGSTARYWACLLYTSPSPRD